MMKSDVLKMGDQKKKIGAEVLDEIVMRERN